jgi:LysM repeat protein
MNRLPAHLTSEDDWKQDRPGVRLSRVFGVVLGIHIVAIGGLMAYEMFRHSDQPSGSTTALRPAVRESRSPSTTPVAAMRPSDAFADDPAHDLMRKHVVASGERLAEIAALYGVDEKVLHAKNRLGPGRPLQSGMKLVIPNRQLQAAVPGAAAAATGSDVPVDPGQLLASPPVKKSAVPTVVESVDDSAVAAAPAAVDDNDDDDGVGAMVAVDPSVYDPSLPVLRAEPVAEAPARKAPVAAAPQKKPVTTPQIAKKQTASSAGTVAVTTAKPKPKAKGRVYVVKDGDTAYRIAKIYGVNVDQLVKTNGINPSTLRPGTTLTIPAAR